MDQPSVNSFEATLIIVLSPLLKPIIKPPKRLELPCTASGGYRCSRPPVSGGRRRGISGIETE